MLDSLGRVLFYSFRLCMCGKILLIKNHWYFIASEEVLDSFIFEEESGSTKCINQRGQRQNGHYFRKDQGRFRSLKNLSSYWTTESVCGTCIVLNTTQGKKGTVYQPSYLPPPPPPTSPLPPSKEHHRTPSFRQRLFKVHCTAYCNHTFAPYRLMSASKTNTVIAEVKTPLSIPITTSPMRIHKIANTLDTLANGTLSPYLELKWGGYTNLLNGRGKIKSITWCPIPNLRVKRLRVLPLRWDANPLQGYTNTLTFHV